MGGGNISARSDETLARIAREHFLTDAHMKPHSSSFECVWYGESNGIMWGVHVSAIHEGASKVRPEFRRPVLKDDLQTRWAEARGAMWIDLNTVTTPEEAMVAIMRRCPRVLRGIDFGDS